MASVDSILSDSILDCGSPSGADFHYEQSGSYSGATDYFPHSRSPSSILPPPSSHSPNFVDHGIITTAHNFINNSLIQSKSRIWTKVYDPLTQAFLSRVPESTLPEVQQAVAAANAAQTTWAATPPHLRRAKVIDLVNALQVNKYKIVHCLVLEIGKTLQDAETEFDRGLDSVLAATSISSEMRGNHWPGAPTNTHTVHEPLGVCVSVTPFNFPFMIPLWTIPLAVITGNTVVLKPSERAPSCSMILADCILNAGFPPGVVNIVHGGASTVAALLSQPVVKAIHYVGSDIGGERVYEHAKANRKRVQVECGGKNHAIVMPDASRRETLYAVAGSAFGSCGQRCMASSVVVLVGSSSEWLPDLVDIAGSLTIGSGSDPSVGMGPLTTAMAKERVIAVINEAEQDGAQVLLDGRQCEVDAYPNGNFVGPTILTGVETYMQCYQEEIFGPVLLCLHVPTLSEAIDLVNDHRYGNGCSIFTSCPATAKTFQDGVNVGQVGINVPVLAPTATIPRTTNKDSFLGDIRGPGAAQWQFYTTTKTVTSLWRPSTSRNPGFGEQYTI